MTSTPRFRKVVAQLVLLVGIFSLAACNSSEDRAQTHYERGLELVDEGELVKASLEFRNALKLNGDHTEALYSLGEVSERQGNPAAAYRIYVAVSEKAPENLNVRIKLIYLLLAANEIDEAQKYIAQAIEIDKEAPEVLVARSSFELRSENLQEAEHLATKALDANPEFVEALAVLASIRMKASDPEGALKFLDKAPSGSERDIGLQALRLSALETMGDQSGVEEQFAELVKLFPENREFSEAWAKWYLSKGRRDDAESVLRQSAQDNPSLDEAQLALVAFLNTHQGADAAAKELEKIIQVRSESGLDDYSLRIALGRLLFSTDQRNEATNLLQTIVADTSDPQNQNSARTILGSMHAQMGNWDEAEQLASKVLANDQKNVDALRLRASIKIQRNDNAAAVDDILLALNEAPEDFRLRAMLASAYERNGSSVLAEEQYAKAFGLDKNSAQTGLPMAQFLLRHGKAAQAQRVLELIRESDPRNRQVLELLAQLKLATQDWVGAQEIADSLRKLDETGENHGADRIAAAALGGLNQHAESLALLESTSLNDDNREAVLPDLIGAYVRAGRHADAMSHLNSALKENPDNALALVLLGSVHMSLGDVEKAKEALLRAVAIDDGVFAQTSLAQFYLATNDLESAEDAIRVGLNKDQNNSALRLMLTSVLQQSGRYDDAIAEYEIMFEADPESTIVANDLASLLSERRGDEQSLDRAFEIAQRFRNSEIPQYLDTLGWIYYLRGEYSSALPLLRSSAQKLPNVGLAQYHLGLVLAAAGQKQQAIATLEKALEIKTLMTEKDVEKTHAVLEELKTAPKGAESN